MSLNNAVRQVAYDNPTAIVRVAAALAANAAGSGSTSGKFTAWAALTVYGVTFFTTTPGTSTATFGGTATSPGTVMSALVVQNTNTTGTAVTLGTTTIGPFIIGGTGTASGGNVGGLSGGLAGGYQGPYALNTIGGTNTQQVVGLTTYSLGYPGNASAGFGGIQLNPGDTVQFVNGTDATAVIIPQLQYSLTGVSGSILS